MIGEDCGEEDGVLFGFYCFTCFAALFDLPLCLSCSFTSFPVSTSYLAIGMVLVSRVRLANTSTSLLTLLALVRR